MDLERARHLSIVASEGSLHRAAVRLGIDQPALSRRIRQLEDEIGVTLFVRSPKGVALTPAGEVLLADLNRLLPQLDSAFDRARRAAAGASTVLRLALTPFVEGSAFTMSSIAAARQAWPDLQFQMQALPTGGEHLEQLQAGLVDLAVLHRRGPLPEQYRSRDLRIDRYQLAVPSAHELIARPSLRLAELRDYDFVFAHQSHFPLVYHEELLACAHGGLAPRIAYEAFNELMFLNIVSEGLAIGFANSAIRDRQWRNVTLLEVEDLNITLPLAAVWKRENESERLSMFVDLLAAHCPVGG